MVRFHEATDEEADSVGVDAGHRRARAGSEALHGAQRVVHAEGGPSEPGPGLGQSQAGQVGQRPAHHVLVLGHVVRAGAVHQPAAVGQQSMRRRQQFLLQPRERLHLLREESERKQTG